MDSSSPSKLLEVGSNHSSTFNYSFLGCFLSWCCYGVIMAQAWTYLRVFHKDPRWLKWSAFVVFLLNTAKASLELSRVVLLNGRYLGDISYALSWRKRLQDPFISFSSVALVSLCQAMLVVRCIACLKSGAEGKESRGRLALKTSLVALLVLSTSLGLAEMALIYSYKDYLQLIVAHLSLNLVPSTILNITWAATSVLLQTILTAILTSDLLCVYDDIQPNAHERTVRRIGFVFVRNGFPILVYQVVFMFFYALSYAVWLTVPLSLTPQLYSITTLVYISAPRRSTRPSLHPPPPPIHSCTNPDEPPNPNSETDSWGSCTCTCCSHHTSRAEVGLHALAKVKERWRSSVRRIRIGETGVTRGVELVEKEEGERNRTRIRLGEGGVSVVEMRSRGSVGGGGKSKDSSKGSVSVATSSMGGGGGGGGGISSGAVKSWGKVDEEESWNERSERMLTPQTSSVPSPSPHPSLPFQQPTSHPSANTPPPRRRPSSPSLDASNADVLGLPVLNDPTAPNSPPSTVGRGIGASTQFGSMVMDEGEVEEEEQRSEGGRVGGNGGALGFQEGSSG